MAFFIPPPHKNSFSNNIENNTEMEIGDEAVRHLNFQKTYGL